MSGPNLNLDYDPLEGPSTRIWKPKEELSERKLEHLKSFIGKFMDNFLRWKAERAAASNKEGEAIPETGSERSSDEVKQKQKDVGEVSSASKMASMELDREKLETIRNLSREMGSMLGPEQKVACGLLFNMAMKEIIFSSGQPDEGQLQKIQGMIRELSANLPRSQRFVFGAVCNMAMQKFRQQVEARHGEEKEQAPVDKDDIEFELD
ncbi:uncharacterized protein LOC119765076 [Culex quinquefasciatus]|uniref:uncharacterized protein LOC119765076 n=1 Tax=Culex quinquefasciatus TaxID=7176 RepID=UPI0018E2A618|nr:uncharacterized protein LOC119765076 [Culex quinquefasciatus]